MLCKENHENDFRLCMRSSENYNHVAMIRKFELYIRYFVNRTMWCSGQGICLPYQMIYLVQNCFYFPTQVLPQVQPREMCAFLISILKPLPLLYHDQSVNILFKPLLHSNKDFLSNVTKYNFTMIRKENVVHEIVCCAWENRLCMRIEVLDEKNLRKNAKWAIERMNDWLFSKDFPFHITHFHWTISQSSIRT